MLQVGVLGSGQAVFDRANSHIHGDLQALLPEALAKIFLSGQQFVVEEVVFDRIVGETICVSTGPGDEIVYAWRPKRFGLSRFVKNRTPEPSKSLIFILKKDEYEDYYILITAFVGGKSEPEPWDRNATEKSVAFWNSHALIWGCEPVVPGSETTRSPW